MGPEAVVSMTYLKMMEEIVQIALVKSTPDVGILLLKQ